MPTAPPAVDHGRLLERAIAAWITYKGFARGQPDASRSRVEHMDTTYNGTPASWTFVVVKTSRDILLGVYRLTPEGNLKLLRRLPAGLRP
jgi:hypothetical protein